MPQIDLVESESGQNRGGKWEPWNGNANLRRSTAERLSALMRGQAVTGVELLSMGGRDEQVVITLSRGVKVHIESFSDRNVKFDYRVPVR